MRVLFIVPTYKPAYIYGGATVVISLLAEELSRIGHDVTVYTTNGNGKSELDIETGREILVEGVRVFYFKRYTRDHSHTSPGIWKKIYLNVKSFDIVHLHSWWNPTIVIAAAICKIKGVKPVLSPHGMFCDYVLYAHNKRKKQLLHLITKSLLRNSFLHVSSEMEWKESLEFSKKEWDGIIIPNLVNFRSCSVNAKSHVQNSPFIIGFISRVDPKKGLDILIKALSKVNFNYKLQIAGGGNETYSSYLNQLAIEYGNADKIEWLGWKDNIQKFDFYSSIDLLALTSLNENFAVVVIESLSVGTAVLLSNHVGLSSYVEENELGWITPIDNISIVTNSLDRIYQEHEKRERIRQTAPEIIQQDYNSHFLTNKYVAFYSKIIKEKERNLIDVLIPESHN